MESVKVSSCDEQKEITYPCLMEGPYSGVVVLMVGKKKGTVVYGTSTQGTKIGEYAENWSNNMVPFNGKLLLEND